MIFKFWVYLLRNAHDIMKIVEVTQKGTCNIFERHCNVLWVKMRMRCHFIPYG